MKIKRASADQLRVFVPDLLSSPDPSRCGASLFVSYGPGQEGITIPCTRGPHSDDIEHAMTIFTDKEGEHAVMFLWDAK